MEKVQKRGTKIIQRLKRTPSVKIFKEFRVSIHKKENQEGMLCVGKCVGRGKPRKPLESPEGRQWLQAEDNYNGKREERTREMCESRKGCSLRGEVPQSLGISNICCRETAQEVGLLIRSLCGIPLQISGVLPAARIWKWLQKDA